MRDNIDTFHANEADGVPIYRKDFSPLASAVLAQGEIAGGGGFLSSQQIDFNGKGNEEDQMAQKNNLPEPVSNALAALNDVNFFDDSSAQPLPRTWI